MLYASLPIAIAAMLGYMFFHAGYSMRRDRVRSMLAARRQRWSDRRVRWAAKAVRVRIPR